MKKRSQNQAALADTFGKSQSWVSKMQHRRLDPMPVEAAELPAWAARNRLNFENGAAERGGPAEPVTFQDAVSEHCYRVLIHLAMTRTRHGLKDTKGNRLAAVVPNLDLLVLQGLYDRTSAKKTDTRAILDRYEPIPVELPENPKQLEREIQRAAALTLESLGHALNAGADRIVLYSTNAEMLGAMVSLAEFDWLLANVPTEVQTFAKNARETSAPANSAEEHATL